MPTNQSELPWLPVYAGDAALPPQEPEFYPQSSVVEPPADDGGDAPIIDLWQPVTNWNPSR